jgi:ABC-type Fe3+-hydroxamate transport system, periplasmic component
MMLTGKRRAALALLLVLVLAMVSACGNQGDPAVENEKAAENETRTFSMANGKTVEIPAHPKRIVMPYEYLGNALALGVKPVGVSQAVMENPYIRDQAEGIENVGNPMSLEKVAELNPDLIIVYLEDQYEQLSKIAPTVLIPFGHYKNIQEEIRVFGELFGKQKEAEEWIQRFEQKAAAAREKIKGVIGEGETVGIYKLQGKDFYVIGDNFGHAGQVIYNALQLTPPEKIRQEVIQGSQWKLISLEALPDYAADHMFWTVYKTDGTEQAESELKNSAIWKNLGAVKDGHVYELKIEDIWFSDAISVEHQLDLVVETLLSAHQK